MRARARKCTGESWHRREACEVTASTGTLSFAAGSDIVITAQVQNLEGPGRNPSGFILSGSAQVTPVPEAGTAAMLAAGLLGVAGLVQRRQRAL